MSAISSCLGTITSHLPSFHTPPSDRPLLDRSHPGYASTSSAETDYNAYPPTHRSTMTHSASLFNGKAVGPGMEAQGEGREWVEGCVFCGVGDKQGFKVVYQVGKPIPGSLRSQRGRGIETIWLSDGADLLIRCSHPWPPVLRGQDDDFAIFWDRSPASRVHLLAVPKCHVDNVKVLRREDLPMGQSAPQAERIHSGPVCSRDLCPASSPPRGSSPAFLSPPRVRRRPQSARWLG